MFQLKSTLNGLAQDIIESRNELGHNIHFFTGIQCDFIATVVMHISCLRGEKCEVVFCYFFIK